MKKTFISLYALLLFCGAFAQEKEIDAALKAYEGKNVAAAKSELSKVSDMVKSSNTISPESLAKYYYVSGKIALDEGNTLDGAKLLSELPKYESGVVYSVKNKATKSTEYYATKEEAEAAAAKGDYSKPKEEKLKANFSPKLREILTPLADRLLQDANSAYNSDKVEIAAAKYLEASYLINVIGGNSGLFKYNAALSYHKGGKYDKAFEVYKELIKDGYTGENVTYVGIDKDGNEVNYNSKEDAENFKKLGLITSYKEVKTPSIQKELYSNTLKALSGMEKYDEVVETISSAYPNDSEIQSIVGNIYYKSGKEDLFLKKLEDNIRLNPKDPVNYFNLGVLYMDKNQDEEALKYFEKAIEVDPNYKNAYNNIALIKVKPEKEYVEIINANLGSSAKERQKYLEYTKKRKDLYVSIIPYLEKVYEIDKTSLEAATMLRKAYQAAEMFDKEDQMRAIEKSLQGK